MKLSKFYKLLKISFVEKELNFTRKAPKKELLYLFLSLLLWTFSFLCSISFVFLSPSYEFKVFYIFSYGLLFGGSIWFVLILWLIILFVKLFNKRLENKCFAWLNKRFKVSWWNFKKQLFKLIFVSFVLILLIYHLVLHFVNVNLKEFDFNYDKFQNIYLYGWWDKFYNVGFINSNSTIIENLTNHYLISNNIGFLFDSILNLLYVISFSYILALVCIILITLYLIKLLFFPILRIKTKNKVIFAFNLSLLNERIMLTNSKKFYTYSKQTKMFYEFLIFLESKIINFRLKDGKLKTLLKELDSHPLQDYLKEFLDNENTENLELIQIQTNNNVHDELSLELDLSDSIFQTNPFEKGEILEEKTPKINVIENSESSIIKPKQGEIHWLDEISPINKGE